MKFLKIKNQSREFSIVTAINRLEFVISSLQEQTPELWKKILDQSKKDQYMDQIAEQELVQIIDNLFTMKI